MTHPHVVTFGCRLNSLESEIIRREAAAAGAGETVVVNTCAVTGEAVRQARQQIRRLRALAEDAGLDPVFAEKFLAFIVEEVIRHHEATAESRQV